MCHQSVSSCEAVVQEHARLHSTELDIIVLLVNPTGADSGVLLDLLAMGEPIVICSRRLIGRISLPAQRRALALVSTHFTAVSRLTLFASWFVHQE